MNDALALAPSSLVKDLPRLYAQDGKGMEATVFLHLFGAIGDFYITEIDEDGDTAFGYTKLAAHPDGAELGYISVAELQELVNEKFIQEKDLRYLIERDLHWTPKPLKDAIK